MQKDTGTGRAGLLVDPAEAAGLDLLESYAAQEAALHAARAVQLHASADLSRRLAGPDGPERYLVIDLAGTLRIGQLAAGKLLADASRLVEVLPATLAGLAAGRVFVPQARIVLEETGSCSARVATEVDRRLHDGAPDGLDGWLARRLCHRVRVLVLQVEAELEPTSVGEREQRARSGRRVCVRPEPDGMASLWALLPAEQLRAFTAGLDELHRRQIVADREAGVERTADQRRADVLAMLPALALHALDGTPAAGGHRCPSPVTAIIHVPLATALGLSDAPAVLEGHGPVSALHARQVLPSATLQRLVVDDLTGQPLHTRTTPTVPPPADPEAGRVGSAADDRALRERLAQLLADPLQPGELADVAEPQHDPSAGLARFVQLRDPLCTAPGCSTSSRSCDLDHEEPWPHGPTAARNLRPRSRRCHRAKTFSWRVGRTASGAHLWTSPTGRTYTVPPPWDPPPTPRSLGAPDVGAGVEGPAGDSDSALTAPLEEAFRAAAARSPNQVAPAEQQPGHTCTPDCEPPF